MTPSEARARRTNPRGVSVTREGPEKWLVRWRDAGRSRRKIVHGSHEVAEAYADQKAAERRAQRRQEKIQRYAKTISGLANRGEIREEHLLALNARVVQDLKVFAAEYGFTFAEAVNEALNWFVRIRAINELIKAEPPSRVGVVPCTGAAASWCPNCGDCSCPLNDVGERTREDERCCLHAPDSPHAERGPTRRLTGARRCNDHPG
jgi:hypothetical protein